MKVTTSKEFIMLQQLIEERCGIFLEEEKAYMLENKLTRMLSEPGFRSLEELYAQICCWNNPELIDSIIDAITVNETFWFRDKTPWLILEDILLPAYIIKIREGELDRVRIWSAACSYGQEPYSIAMCIDHYLKCHDIRDINLDHFEILATDISCTVLRTARMGRYDNISIQRGLDDAYKSEYFRNEGRVWNINNEIRNAVRFQQFNLIKESFPYNKFDIIFLRNVLIYFSDKQKKEVMGKIKYALRPAGSLFIGSSELLTDYDLNLSIVEHKNGVYFK